MAFVSWFILWIIFASVGLILVYRVGLYIELRWPTLGLFYFVLSGPCVLIASWMVTDQIIGLEQASCEEMNPGADRLHGMSPSEFRQRCIATLNESAWLDWRKP
jgi:hypothetical protein